MVRTAGRYLRRTHVRSMHSTSGVWVCCLHQMVPICTEWWCTEANETTQTHCYNPIAPAIWAYYAHGWQRRCQEDPVSLPSSRLEKTTRSSPHHVAQHRPTGSETTPPYATRSSRFGSEPPSVEDNVDVWRYAILRVACQKRRRRSVMAWSSAQKMLVLFGSRTDSEEVRLTTAQATRFYLSDPSVYNRQKPLYSSHSS